MPLSRILILMTLVLAVSSALLAGLSAVSDRARHTPQRAYEKWFRGPVPAGVTQLQVAGQWWERGRATWFRFQATPAALESVSVAFAPEAFDRDALLAGKWSWAPLLRRDDPQNRLRWSDLYAVRRAKYSVRRLYNDAVMWVDPDTSTVYVYGIGR